MKIMVSENVIHFHEIELSDEIDVENLINLANKMKKRYETGYETIEDILRTYRAQFGEAFDYKVVPNACGAICEGIEFERELCS